MSEYTPYIFLNRIDEGTVDDVYVDALDIAKNDNVSVVRIYPSDIYDLDIDSLEIPEEFNEGDLEKVTEAEQTATASSTDMRVDDNENFPSGTPYTGEGIKIGLLDTGIFDASHFNFSDITKEVVYDTYTANNSEDSAQHPTWVASVLGGKSGYASKASIYYVDVNSETGYIGIERLISKGCHIVNMSISANSCNNNGEYDTGLEGYLDYIYNSTKIIMVASASNNLNKVGTGGFVALPALCANVISVGSVTYAAVPVPSEFSSYKIKNDVASNPNLVAVGTDRNVGGFGNLSGTSFSAPAVTGAIALYFEKYGVYELPEVLSVLLATADRDVNTATQSVRMYQLNSSNEYVPTGTFTTHTNNLKSNGLRERTGAGVLDVTYLLMCNTFLCNSSMTFTSSNYVTIGNVYIGAGRTAQIALAWERAATRTVEGALWWQTETYSSDPLADFDLYLFDSDGSSVGIGWSSSSNVEIIDFTAPTAGFYTVKIKPQSNYTGTHNINCVSLVK